MRVSPQQDDFDLYEDLNSFKNLQKRGLEINYKVALTSDKSKKRRLQ